MKLEINGQVVEVDDSFEKLSDAEKEATVNEIAASLRPAPSAQASPDTANPMYGIGGGAAAANLLGRPINKFFEGADKVAPPAGGQGLHVAPQGVPPEIAAKGPDAVENWTRTQHAGEFYGGKDYAGAHQRAMNVKSTLAETPGYRAMQGTGLIAPREAVEGYEASQAAAARRAMPVTQRLIQSSPAAGRTAAGASNILRSGVPPFIGRTTAGGVGGYLGVDAYNRALEGDVSGAMISGAGATGAGLSMVPRPKVRGLGILGAGAALGANALRDQKAPPPKKSVMEGYAGGGKTIKGGLGLIGRGVYDAPRVNQTVMNPLRMSYPGIYERPDEIARKAAANTAPESPLLKQLFGVTRDDLYEISKRRGNVPGVIPGAAKNPKGSAAAEAVMVPQNEQRLLDIIYELQKNAPEMYRGMHGWYVMDPEYQHMVKMMGPEKAKQLYERLNVFGGIESPNMPVPQEFKRATAASMLAEQNRWPEWVKHGGVKSENKLLIPDYPQDLMSVPGRVGHQRAAKSQTKYLETGEHGMESPKAPPYIQGSSVPELGFQTDVPIGDAHWSRDIGLADVRTGKSTAESVSTPEIQQLAPWFREKIAGEAGTESVPAQAILWGGLGHATGVKTKVGAPKLELHAIEIGNAAKRLGISPEEARDLILSAQERAGKKTGGLVDIC